MPNISILLTFRNRDIIRVKRCLDSLEKQTNPDFEVILIDYGSLPIVREEIKTLAQHYPFVHYHYLATEGWVWNRAHALNAGIRLAQSEYILTGDIDLIYSAGITDTLCKEAATDRLIYNPVYWLPRTFNNWNTLQNTPLNTLQQSGNHPIGAFMFMSKQSLWKMGGLDEFYCFWGVEDRDIANRLNKSGLKLISIDPTVNPVFHQWHPVVSDRKKDFFPEKWWDDINLYYALQKHQIVRNNENWGQITQPADRPVLNANSIPFTFPFTTAKSYEKPLIIERLIDHLQALGTNECLSIELKKQHHGALSTLMIKYINLISRKLHGSSGLDYIENVEREKYINPNKDIMYIIWQLIAKENKIVDYFIEETTDKIRIKLMPVP